jgi:hypothetical protein
MKLKWIIKYNTVSLFNMKQRKCPKGMTGVRAIFSKKTFLVMAPLIYGKGKI